MDKLQPIIKHHFWIVFALASILPPVAWWLTTSELSAEISERTSSLDSIYSGIANGQNAPNDDWTNGVNQLIAIRTEANRLALDRLWTAQNELMVWPPNVSKWMVNCPYRGEIEDARIKQILPDLYRDDYEREVRRVWLIPQPIDDKTTRIDPGLKQKVVFPYQAMPRTEASKWRLLPPTWQEIWNAQEDLWLLTEILEAVRNTNESTSSITDSYVKQILQVQLFGGKRADAPAGSSGSSAGPGGMPGMPGMPGMMRSMAARGTGNELSRPAEFPVSEEFEVASSGVTTMYDTSSGSSAAESGAASGVDPNSDEGRYIQSEEAYRTRGFKLKVAIHQMQVPNLIRELLNSQYPIEIIRFQQSAMNPEEPGKPSTSASGYPGANSGFPGMTSGFPGEDSGEFLNDSSSASLESSSSEESFGFDESGSGGDSLSGKAYSVPAIANVVASLEDRDLVELVVVGEIYIYNPPAVDESATDGGTEPADAVAAAPASDGSAIAPIDASTDLTDTTATAGSPLEPASPIGVDPPSTVPVGNTATTTDVTTTDVGGTVPPATTVPTTEPANSSSAADTAEPAPADGSPATSNATPPPAGSSDAVP